MHPLRTIDLGALEYTAAFERQQLEHAAILAARDAGAPEVGRLLLVEHNPPVITISRRPEARKHLTATADQLARAGIEVLETDRGGDITYHGPGQLVAYPILDLNTLGLNLHAYMRLLETVVIDTLSAFSMSAERETGVTGVWANRKKICAMGVRIRRWVSMHGLALNVTTNLDHFDLIVPCGLAGRTVTSMSRELGGKCPTMDQVKRELVAAFEHHLNHAFMKKPVFAPPSGE